MAVLQKIDSNGTGLRFAFEDSLGVLPVTPTWYALEPNSYNDFGGQIATVARNPINAGRQRQKGTTVDLDSAGGFSSDLTLNLQDLLQSFFFASHRRKGEAAFSGTQFSEDFTAANAADTLTITAHGLSTGDGPFQATTTTTLPDGIAAATNYWVIVVDDDTLQLAASYADALAGTEVTFDDDGTGTHTLTSTGAVDTTGDTFVVNNPAGFYAGSLVFAKGFTNTANNGLHLASSVTGAAVAVSTNLTTEATPPADAALTVVGFQFTAGDLEVDASGDLPVLTSSTKDLRDLGLIPGEMIYIGGDATAMHFTNAVNNGWARVKTIAQNAITLDKTQGVMITETDVGNALTVQVFFGRVLKNEADPALQVRRTVQLERSLGAPETTQPSQIQGEYIIGAVANEFVIRKETAAKIECDLSFIGTDFAQRKASDGLKSGNRPSLAALDAYNTSNDVKLLRMNVIDPEDSSPSALFAYLTEFTVSINNNASPNKAISVLGAFEVTVGDFTVDGSAEAYFSTVEAVQAIRANADVTMWYALAKANAGVAVDIPLIALGEGRLNVEKDQPIKLPLALPAAEDRDMHHTLMMSFFDYLPDAAIE